MGWLTTFLGFFTGLAGPISAVVNSLNRAKLAGLAAETYVAKKQIDLEIEEIQARKAVLVAEAGSRIGLLFNSSVRTLIALGPALYLSKIFIWDKVVGSFMGCVGPRPMKGVSCTTYNTDPLDPNLWWVVTAIIGFYFMYSFGARFRK